MTINRFLAMCKLLTFVDSEGFFLCSHPLLASSHEANSARKRYYRVSEINRRMILSGPYRSGASACGSENPPGEVLFYSSQLCSAMEGGHDPVEFLKDMETEFLQANG